ncbi:MAG: YkgJ family cysteine cluster protein [Desulfobacterales bacterium]|nr:YkgJ family cysteine cluster protein [Desulfobacterales bacterium]MCP4162652.1 YkgJ family cysteine cluster protein [Deltaproteobacteria bacterium]
MKSVEISEIDKLPGKRIDSGEPFKFKCHKDVSCFNLCCRNLNLFLYPYDVLRLKNELNISSDEFIEKHTDIVLREGNYFPDVLLKMADNEEKTCPFLSKEGCSVYSGRPDSCRTFPVEHGVIFGESGKADMISFFKPPEFCRGQDEDTVWTKETWSKDQEAEKYYKMTLLWAEVKALFGNDPWGPEGANGQRAKMAFMSAYNMDIFSDFILKSSFKKRFKIKADVLKKIKKNETEMLKFGFSWIKFYLWNLPTKKFKKL